MPPIRPLTALLTSVLISSSAMATTDKVWITLGNNAYSLLSEVHPQAKSMAKRHAITSDNETVHVVKINTDVLMNLSKAIHRELRHCGGFIVHRSEQEARASLSPPSPLPNITVPNYEIKNDNEVQKLLPLLQASHIVTTITDLSSFQNRFYTTTQGVDAANWLAEKWQQLAGTQQDVAVETFTHDKWPQRSVILTIKGQGQAANEIVVLGAHLDSISNGARALDDSHAPGADDNASGIASLTEVIRVLLSNDHRPRRTLKFIAYAAEEVGLRGSGEIARHHYEQGANVVGVLQLDMTNYHKPSDDKIYLITDYTNRKQNNFLTKLVKHYLPELQVSTSQCGYACSDHASWTRHGYAASFPFESAFKDSNPYIHTENDTLNHSDQEAKHALKFAQLALAYTVELGKGE